MTEDTGENLTFGKLFTDSRNLPEGLITDDTLPIVQENLGLHIPLERLRVATIDEFVGGVVSSIDMENNNGIPWLGNTFVMCGGGIDRSDATARVLRTVFPEQQRLINLKASTPGGFGFSVASLREEAPRFEVVEYEDADDTVSKLRLKGGISSDSIDIDTLVVHITPNRGQSKSEVVGLLNLISFLNTINPENDEGRMRLDLNILLVLGDEVAVRQRYHDYGFELRNR